MLDYAIAGEIRTTIKYVLLLISFILGEVLFYYLYKRCSAKYVTECTRMLKRDVFESILRRSYVDYKSQQQGEYLAKLTNDADAIQNRRFQMLPLFFDILSKIVFVSAALFLLDWRLALVTIALLTTPLYVPKLIEKRLQNAQTAYLKAVEKHLAKVNDWLSGFEIIKNFSVERQILRRFDDSNDSVMDKLLKDSLLGAVSQLITTLISYLSYFIVLVFAAWLVLRGDFTAGNFFVAIGMIDQLSYPLISLAEIIRQLVAIKPACDAMERFIAYGASKGGKRYLCLPGRRAGFESLSSDGKTRTKDPHQRTERMRQNNCSESAAALFLRQQRRDYRRQRADFGIRQHIRLHDGREAGGGAVSRYASKQPDDVPRDSG